MTTHPRTRVLHAGVVMRAGVLAAVLLGSTAALQSPALAADAKIQSVSLSNSSLRSGDQAKLTFKVGNPSNEGEHPTNKVLVRVTGDGVACTGSCEFAPIIAPGTSQDFTVTLTASNLEPGQKKDGSVRIEATLEGGRTDSTSKTITVRGPDEQPSATQVSGKVLDANTGKPVAGADVAMTDGKNQQWSTTTNGNGQYRFTASKEKPITPGRIDIGAMRDGYQRVFGKGTAVAGKPLSIRLMIQSTTAPTPTATPSATPEATDEPAEEATPDTLVGQQPTANKAAADDSGGSWKFILIGGLLVAVGVGAMVLVLLRRKDNDADGDDAGTAAAASGAAAPAGPGVYRGAPDATQVAGRGGVADATMVTGGGIPPSLADAPTMLQRPVPAEGADEFADPYGAPLPTAQSPAYGAAGQVPGQPNGWGAPAYPTAAAAAGPVDATYRAPAAPGQQPGGTYGGQPAQGAAYGAPVPRQEQPYGNRDYPPPNQPTGYPPAPGAYGQRYDEPTGRYEPPAGGYPAQDYRAGAAGHAPEGYEPETGYPAGGYGAARTGYGPGGQYAGQPPAGYDAPAGGYDAPPAGYDAPPAVYGRPAGGYEPGARGAGEPAAGGYGGATAPAPGGHSGNSYGAAPGGYEGTNGYDPRPGYDQHGGYGGRPPAQGGGYERGGQYGGDAGQPPSRHGMAGPPDGGAPPAQPPVAEQRRPLDWLDD